MQCNRDDGGKDTAVDLLVFPRGFVRLVEMNCLPVYSRLRVKYQRRTSCLILHRSFDHDGFGRALL